MPRGNRWSGAAGGPVGGRGFAAFISYSHAADGVLAPALQRGLHSLAKPWYRRRALRVFLDDANLTANPDLWRSIEVALRNSEFLILLACPSSAASTWVQREVEFWLRHKSAETLRIVLTSGQVAWDDAAKDFDWRRTTALPVVLRGVYAAEPFITRFDEVAESGAASMQLQDPRFRSAVATLAAPLHHREKDDLIGEDLRQHRRTMSIARAVIASLTGLALLLTGATYYAFQQRAAALQRRDVAVSRQLAAQAELRATTDAQSALQLAVAAYRINRSDEATAGLLRQLQANPAHLAVHLRSGYPC